MTEIAAVLVLSLAVGWVGMKIWSDKGGEPWKGFVFSLTWFGFIYVLVVAPPSPRIPRSHEISEGDTFELRRTFRAGLTILHKGARVKVVGKKRRGSFLVEPVNRELRRPAEAWPQELALPRD